IDGEEQPFAVDDLGDAADIAGDRAVEARVEAGLGAIEKRVEARKAAIRGAVAILGLEQRRGQRGAQDQRDEHRQGHRSEEHTSELPVTNAPLVCRLLLEKKKQNKKMSKKRGLILQIMQHRTGPKKKYKHRQETK